MSNVDRNATLAALSPKAVTDYLRRTGWTQPEDNYGRDATLTAVFVHPELGADDFAMVPLRRDLGDYVQRMREAVNLVGKVEHRWLDIIADMRRGVGCETSEGAPVIVSMMESTLEALCATGRSSADRIAVLEGELRDYERSMAKANEEIRRLKEERQRLLHLTPNEIRAEAGLPAMGQAFNIEEEDDTPHGEGSCAALDIHPPFRPRHVPALAEPCPDCGAAPRMEATGSRGPRRHRIRCTSIACSRSATWLTGRTKAEVIRAWNALKAGG